MESSYKIYQGVGGLDEALGKAIEYSHGFKRSGGKVRPVVHTTPAGYDFLVAISVGKARWPVFLSAGDVREALDMMDRATGLVHIVFQAVANELGRISGPAEINPCRDASISTLSR